MQWTTCACVCVCVRALNCIVLIWLWNDIRALESTFHQYKNNPYIGRWIKLLHHFLQNKNMHRFDVRFIFLHQREKKLNYNVWTTTHPANLTSFQLNHFDVTNLDAFKVKHFINIALFRLNAIVKEPSENTHTWCYTKNLWKKKHLRELQQMIWFSYLDE